MTAPCQPSVKIEAARISSKHPYDVCINRNWMFLQFVPKFRAKRDAIVAEGSGFAVLVSDPQLYGIEEVDA